MYGSIFRMKVKEGAENRIAELMEEWERDVRPDVPGALGGYLMKPDNANGELVGVAVFEDRESYRANAESPKQDEWYRKMRDQLEDDPAWEDGEFLGAWS